MQSISIQRDFDQLSNRLPTLLVPTFTFRYSGKKKLSYITPKTVNKALPGRLFKQKVLPNSCQI